MSNKTEELHLIFTALNKVKGILGEEMLDQIRRKLISGALAEGERDFLQGLRRDAVAKNLGMTREEYEKSL